MTSLATLLDAPIAWTKPDRDTKTFLDDLQANILKGHGRKFSGHIFLSFTGMKDPAALVRSLGQHCTSAAQQLRANKKHPPHIDGGPVRCLFLSALGYRALGVRGPSGAAFRAGMAAPGEQIILNDPPRSTWDAGWQTTPDAMFLVADASEDAVTADLEAAEGWLNGTGAKILVVERGLQQTRMFRPGIADGVEHFGYIDGRSQPLFVAEDIADEPAKNWNPAFKPSQFIVPDPNGKTKLSAGSFLVFRKLEQNVRGFNAAETALGQGYFGSAATDEQLDRAGAMVVGRFEDGTPVALSPTEQHLVPPNDFVFDADGGKCPFHAHIRKVNPRDDASRSHIMARRGITYGPRRPMTADQSDFADAGTEPERDSGLLFMAYMASIEDQFEYTQRRFANAAPTDPVIGPGGTRAYRDGWTDGPVRQLSFDQFVTLKGGEYFFAPSIGFLRGLK